MKEMVLNIPLSKIFSRRKSRARKIENVEIQNDVWQMKVQEIQKKGLVVKILGRTNRTHSKLVRDFSKKLLTDIFGCPKLHVG